MKNLFELSKEEKNRIINLHENATKRLYLVEQQVVQGGATDPYQYRKTGDKVEYAKKGTENWQVQTNPKGVEAINNLFLKSAPTTTPNVNQTGDADNEPNPTTPTTTAGTNPTTTAGTNPTTNTGTTSTNTQNPSSPQDSSENNEPAADPSTLRDKITTNCGEIWDSYLTRLKGYQEQMKGKDLKSQKEIAKVMSKDEKKTFDYCHKLYKPKMSPEEKTDYTNLGTNFKKFLSTSYKFLAPSVVKMMQTTVEKAADTGTQNVLKSLKLTGESRYKESDLNRLIKESIRKNTKNL
jgi:hypothetical protein